MDKYKIEFLQTANDDLDGIFNYIFLDSPKSAGNMLDKIFARLRQLEHFPQSGTLLSEKSLKKYGFRMLVEEPYIIFYSIDTKIKTVYIHRILHGARDWVAVLL